ncbi:MAG: hypothetical protein ACOVS5_13905 [Oligoflexus sp.]
MSTNGQNSAKKTRRVRGSSGREAIDRVAKAELWRLRQIEVMYFALQMAIIEKTELKDRIEKLQPDHPMELDHIIQDYITDRVSRFAN